MGNWSKDKADKILVGRGILRKLLTSGVWHDANWDRIDGLNAIEKTQLTQSDVISFHDYNWPERFEARVKELQVYGRPLLCTEYMARGNGSTIDTVLPLGKTLDVGMINWGFVDGKSQTRYPWDSWQKPYVPNMTGTPQAYRPPGSILLGASAAPTTPDYEAWKPE